MVYLDQDDYRLQVAKKMGATHTYNVKGNSDVRALVKEHIGEADGFDVVMEAVGIPATFDMCQQLVGLGGHIAVSTTGTNTESAEIYTDARH